jgi:hypothetical protein
MTDARAFIEIGGQRLRVVARQENPKRRGFGVGAFTAPPDCMTRSALPLGDGASVSNDRSRSRFARVASRSGARRGKKQRQAWQDA